MKKVTMETNFNEIKELAKELGIKYVGVKKEDLVNQINEAQAPKEEVKVRSLEDYNLVEGQVVTITGRIKDGTKHILALRQVQITRATKTEGFVKGHLLNKDGQPQKTEIALPVSVIITGGEVEVA